MGEGLKALMKVLIKSSTLWMPSMKPVVPISPHSVMKAGSSSRRDMMMAVSQEGH